MNRHRFFPVALIAMMALASLPCGAVASDHLDSPAAADDHASDLADQYLFLDPNDNTRVIAIMTFAGFIVPGENSNAAVFGQNGTVRFNFDFENTGDAVPDKSVHVTFGPKTSGTTGQTATIELWDGSTFTAPTTPASNTATTSADPIITTNDVTGIRFFAGLVDDPFFFDIPGFNRFTASVRAGTPDATVLSRGRDSFAGYNILSIALSIPAGLLKGTNGNVVGLNSTSQRRIVQFVSANGQIAGSGRWVNVDRQGIPGINVVLIPFARKTEYNHATTMDDAAGKFANDIVATLTSLGTNGTNIGILAGLAVTKGDFLRIDTSKANTGTGGGTVAGAGFPNGRRLSDDVIDTFLFFVANQNTLGDSVNGNDVPFRDTFPFLAPSQQPRNTGTIDDNTRN
jgi:hypothetical protein